MGGFYLCSYWHWKQAENAASDFYQKRSIENSDRSAGLMNILFKLALPKADSVLWIKHLMIQQYFKML